MNPDDGASKPLLESQTSAEANRRYSEDVGGLANLAEGVAVTDSRSFFVVSVVIILTQGACVFGMGLGYTSPTLLDVKHDLELDTNEGSFFGSIFTLGGMAGAILGSRLGDALGRRKTLLLSMVPSVVGWIVISIARSYSILLLGRTLTGIACGLVAFVVPVFVAEISPPKLRGTLGTLFQVMVTLGILLVYLFGLVFHWRGLAIVPLVPSGLLLLGVATVVPESPRWLARNRQQGRAKRVLADLRMTTESSHAVTTEFDAILTELNSENKEAASLGELVRDPVARTPLILSLMMMVIQQFSGVNAVIFYSGSIFQSAGFGSSSNAAAISVGATQVVVTLVSAWLMDRAGRRKLLIVSCTGMAIMAVLLGSFFYMKDVHDNRVPDLAIGSLMMYIAFFSIGLGAIPWLLMGELFSDRYRSTAASVATMANYLLSFVVAQTYSDLEKGLTTYGTFWLYGAICILGMIYVNAALPETKGITLEEIQRALSSQTNSELREASDYPV